jgi:hypothetical protein
MRTYQSGVFSTVFDSEIGPKLWSYLNSPEAIAMMKAAAALDRPSVEALEEPLMEHFSNRIMEHRVKQMCGHMVRQVMEAEGYQVGVQNTKITNGAPFSRGTKYRKKDEIVMHSFRNAADPRLFAITPHKAGSGLPTADGTRWYYHQAIKGGARISLLTLTKLEAALAAIQKDGHLVYHMDRITRAAH